MTFMTVLRTECTKLRRSRVTWITFGVYAAMAGIAGLFMWMMKNPGSAQGLGLMGQKAQFAFGGVSTDWAGFLGFIVELGGIGGLMMASVVVTWIFGREYVEGTAKSMFCLPVPRGWFVWAKIVVAAAWCAALTLWLMGAASLAGSAIGLAGASRAVFAAAIGRLFALSAMSLCCALLAGWVAVETRGYFAPLGFSVGTLALASVFGHTGWAPWVPWSIVGLYSGAAGTPAEPGPASLAIIAATFLIGAALILRHEVRADNAQ